MLVVILCLLPFSFIFPFSLKLYFVCSESFNFVKLNDLSHLFSPGHKQTWKFYLRNILMLKEDICLRVAWVQCFSVVNWGYWIWKTQGDSKVLGVPEFFAMMTWYSEFHSSQPWYRNNNITTNNALKNKMIVMKMIYKL